ncbi:hypothetical protein FA95DRAFT_1575733 [Auriscalpium vulgare]|uniref:Uncharacterized protein n=1 Tax=Auriscalpium vulgare TaxID=40419 RepID=A0ACB8RF14_9AGAM|nr:hypothetical protein FA95DRAFT_1575733 [Auriscalpium vulgare]
MKMRPAAPGSGRSPEPLPLESTNLKAWREGKCGQRTRVYEKDECARRPAQAERASGEATVLAGGEGELVDIGKSMFEFAREEMFPIDEDEMRTTDNGSEGNHGQAANTTPPCAVGLDDPHCGVRVRLAATPDSTAQIHCLGILPMPE